MTKECIHFLIILKTVVMNRNVFFEREKKLRKTFPVDKLYFIRNYSSDFLYRGVDNDSLFCFYFASDQDM